MAWVVDAGIRADAIISTIRTNLMANGWSEVDGTPYFVFSAVNSQGVTQYVQITQSGTYTYIQFQGWRAWAAHAGSNGSDNGKCGRVYLGPAPIAAATLVDMYMSITANRIIVAIDSKTTNYRNWVYFGGFDTAIAGTADPNCVFLLSSKDGAVTTWLGQTLLSQGGGTFYWPNTWIGGNPTGAFLGSVDGLGQTRQCYSQLLPFNGGKILLYPIYAYDSYAYSTGTAGGYGNTQLRGMFDGLLFAPFGSTPQNVSYGAGVLAHLDTVIVGAITYLIFQPGGTIGDRDQPIGGNYSHGIAIAEV
jgi:hypothetical protein